MTTSPAPTPCDLLIRCRWCIPVVPANSLIEQAAIAITGDRVAGIGPRAQLQATFNPRQTVDLDRHAVIPGLVNAHGHAAMTLLRGSAEDLPLRQWLNDVIWPLEAAHVSRDYVRTGTELAMLEMLSSGTTTFADMYYFPDEVARCATRAGMRAQVAFPIIDFPNVWSHNANDGLHKGLALHDEYRDDALIKVIFGPHAAYSIAPEVLERIGTYAEETNLPIQMHLHENAEELAQARARAGKSWLYYLDDLGLLSPSLQAVHMTQLTDHEITLIGEHGVNVIHCPHSNLKMASGVCPLSRLLDAGIRVGLGTDGAASNNCLDLLAEARLAALLLKQSSGDSTLGDTATMLEMATLGGARVLGLDEEIGSLEVGKLADLVAFDFGAARFTPMRNPAATLIHGAASAALSHVWVGGRCLYDDRKFTTLDPAASTARASALKELPV